MTLFEHNSVITKLPSAAVGVLGRDSEFKRNNLPLERAHATLLKLGKYNKASTELLPSDSKEYENILYPSVALEIIILLRKIHFQIQLTNSHEFCRHNLQSKLLHPLYMLLLVLWAKPLYDIATIPYL